MASPDQARRILFVRTDRLGETLLNLPAMAAVKAAIPGSRLTLLVHQDLAPLLARVPAADEVIGWTSEGFPLWWLRAWRLGRLLRAGRFDLAVVSNPKKELHAAVWLAGIPVRVGYDRKWGGLLTHRVPDRKALGDRHEVEYNLDLIQALGFPTSSPPWRFPSLEREQAEVLQLLHQEGASSAKPLLAVHPWTSHPAKRWPLDRYRTLIRRIGERLPCHVVLIGGPETRSEVRSVLPEGAAVTDLVGRVSLVQLAALLQRAALLISNDSGPVHLAAAVGTPAVVLFGSQEAASGPRRWGPWGDGHTVIWRSSLDAIDVDEVMAAIERYMAPKA